MNMYISGFLSDIKKKKKINKTKGQKFNLELKRKLIKDGSLKNRSRK